MPCGVIPDRGVVHVVRLHGGIGREHAGLAQVRTDLDDARSWQGEVNLTPVLASVHCEAPVGLFEDLLRFFGQVVASVDNLEFVFALATGGMTVCHTRGGREARVPREAKQSSE